MKYRDTYRIVTQVSRYVSHRDFRYRATPSHCWYNNIVWVWSSLFTGVELQNTEGVHCEWADTSVDNRRESLVESRPVVSQSERLVWTRLSAAVQHFLLWVTLLRRRKVKSNPQIDSLWAVRIYNQCCYIQVYYKFAYISYRRTLFCGNYV